MQLRLSGQFCTSPAANVIYPVKIMFITDGSGSQQFTDQNRQRVVAVTETIQKLIGAGNVFFKILVFNSAITATPKVAPDAARLHQQPWPTCSPVSTTSLKRTRSPTIKARLLSRIASWSATWRACAPIHSRASPSSVAPNTCSSSCRTVSPIRSARSVSVTTSHPPPTSPMASTISAKIPTTSPAFCTLAPAPTTAHSAAPQTYPPPCASRRRLSE